MFTVIISLNLVNMIIIAVADLENPCGGLLVYIYIYIYIYLYIAKFEGVVS